MRQKAHSVLLAALCSLSLPATGWAFLDFFDKDLQNAPVGEEMQRQEGLARGMVDEAAALETSNPDKARNIYRDVVKKYPLTATAGLAQYQVGVLYRGEGKHIKAFGAFQDFVDNYKRSAAFASAVQAQYEIARDGQAGSVKDKFMGIGRRLQPSELLDFYTKIIANAPYSEYAPLSQFAIGEVHQEKGEATEAIAAYQKMVDDYPRSPKAAEAQLRIGAIGDEMLKRGNQDAGKVETAKKAYEDLLIQYPDHELAAEARAGIAKLDIGSAAKAYDIGRFYEKQGRYSSARVYYEQVVAVPDSEYAAKASDRLANLPENKPDTASNKPYFPELKTEKTKGFGFPKLFGKKDETVAATGDGDLFPGEVSGDASDSDWEAMDRELRDGTAMPEPAEEKKGLSKLAFWKKDKDQAVDADDESFPAPVAAVDDADPEKKKFLKMPKLPTFGKDKESDALASADTPAPVKVKNKPNYVGPPAPKKQTSTVAMRLNSKAVPLIGDPEAGLAPEPDLDDVPAASELPKELVAPAPPAE